MKADPGKICGSCQLGKKIQLSYKVTQHLSTTRVPELIHIYLMGPMQVESLVGKRYAFVCVDDFSSYSWVHFLKEKSDTFDAFEALFIKLVLEKNPHRKMVVRIRSDHGREFENSHIDNFCNKQGIRHEFSAPKTSQHNEVVERKNKTLQEMACVMLKAKNIPVQLWAKALNTTFYIQNRVYLRPGTAMTPYEIWRGKKPNMKHFHEFGSTCIMLNDREHMSKFDLKSDKGMFLGYSLSSRAYKVFNK